MLPNARINVASTTEIIVGIAIFFQKAFPVVLLYFKYCVTAVSRPMIIATNICIWLYAISSSSGAANFTSNILLITGNDVLLMITIADKKKTNAPINIQNSRELPLSSLVIVGTCFCIW